MKKSLKDLVIVLCMLFLVVPVLAACSSPANISTKHKVGFDFGQGGTVVVLCGTTGAVHEGVYATGSVLFLIVTPSETHDIMSVKAGNSDLAGINNVYIHALTADVILKVDFKEKDVSQPPPTETPIFNPDGLVTMESEFPALHISTGGRSIDSTTDWVKDVSVSMRNTEDAYEFEGFENARIRGRGNSTWSLGMEYGKKPYRLQFNEPIRFLDSPAVARNWALIANFSDKTLLRTYSAYFLGGMLDTMHWSPYARFIDLYLDDVYQGVYMVTDHMNDDVPGRSDLVSDTVNYDPEVQEYLVELNGRIADEDGPEMEGRSYVIVNGRHYEIRIPEANEARQRVYAEYVRQYIAAVDAAIELGDWTEITSLIDPASFVDYFLVREFYKCGDVGWTSVQFQIRGQGAERRLYMGPLWDFDLSAGNYEVLDLDKPEGIYAAAANHWFRGLVQVDEFRELIAVRWNELKDNQIARMLEHIAYMAVRYQSSLERNFEVWNIMGIYIWPNPQEIIEIETFMGHVFHMINWLETRCAWLADYYSNAAFLESAF